MGAWTSFLSAMLLTLVRVSGIVVFAPFFSSTALPARTKAVFVGAVAFLLAPLVATLPNAHAEISLTALLGEVAIGLVYGLALSLLNEMLLFAGQIAGVQFSFSMVNLLDPTSSIQTPLMRRSLSTYGDSGSDYCRARPHSAGFAGAQFSCYTARWLHACVSYRARHRPGCGRHFSCRGGTRRTGSRCHHAHRDRRRSAQQTQLSAVQTSLMQADLATVATQLSLSKTQETALESVISQLGSGSLFDKLQG